MLPAARITDLQVCPVILPGPVQHVGGPVSSGAQMVIIGGQPAARLGDSAVCGPTSTCIAKGEPSVLIEGQPAARLSDATSHGGMVTSGCPTVLIGRSAQVMTMQAASQSGKPFCEQCEAK